MNFLKDFCVNVANIPLGEHFPLISASTILIIVLATFILLASITRLRKFNKAVILCAVLTMISITFFKVFCDYVCKKPINNYSLTLALAILPVIFIFCALLFTFKTTDIAINSSEKRLIEELLSETEPKNSLLQQKDFSENPFKRIEYLTTKKGFYEHPFNDFNLNPSHVEKYVHELLQKNLSDTDRQEVNQIYSTVQKYKLKNLSDFERDDFSTTLQKLLKLTAKYDNANFDLY